MCLFRSTHTYNCQTAPTMGRDLAPFWHPVGYAGPMGGNIDESMLGEGRSFPLSDVKMVIFDVLTETPNLNCMDIKARCAKRGCVQERKVCTYVCACVCGAALLISLITWTASLPAFRPCVQHKRRSSKRRCTRWKRKGMQRRRCALRLGQAQSGLRGKLYSTSNEKPA